jgi:DNA-binding response OmpR family regulator
MKRPRRVLVVDDDDAIRSLLRLTLSTEDYEVTEAVDGVHALEVLAESDPELILLDWKMPGRHGSLVLDDVKARRPTVPVIVLTSEIQDHHRALAESLGVDAFLTKPFSPMELLATVERLLAKSPLDQAP